MTTTLPQINVGNEPNDGMGASTRAAFQQVNANFGIVGPAVDTAQARADAAYSLAQGAITGTGFATLTTGRLTLSQVPIFSGGDVVGTGGTGILSLAPGVVRNATQAAMPAYTVKANPSAVSAAPSDVTLTALLDTLSQQQGAILYRSVSAWTVLNPGVSGALLTARGNNMDPAWVVPSGAGLRASGTPTTGQLGVFTSASLLQGVTLLPAANFPALTGDLAGIAGSLAVYLAASGVTAGTYSNPTMTVDNKGRVVSISSGSSGGGGGGGTVTTSGSPANGQLASFTGASVITGLTTLPTSALPAFTGDVTSVAGSATLTLGTSGVAAGTYGSATQSAVIQVDAKGRVVSASNATITGGASSPFGTATNYTPSTNASGGASGTYILMGPNLVYVEIIINGSSGGNYPTATLPFAAGQTLILPAREDQATGDVCVGEVNAGSSTVTFSRSGNANPLSSSGRIIVTGVYRKSS